MPTTDYAQLFQSRLDEIDQLERTPDLIKQHAIATLDNALRINIGNVQAHQALENGRAALANVSDESIAANYRVIYSQMCILGVSSLEAILKKYFEHAADNYQNLVISNPRLKQIKVTAEDIVNSGLRFGGKLGRLILDKDKPNFQDLKSIKDVFLGYFGKEISLTDLSQKRLVFYLEARHVLVHRGGTVDDKFIQAVTKIDANLHNLSAGEQLTLGREDWEAIRLSFMELVRVTTTSSRQP